VRRPAVSASPFPTVGFRYHHLNSSLTDDSPVSVILRISNDGPQASRWTTERKVNRDRSFRGPRRRRLETLRIRAVRKNAIHRQNAPTLKLGEARPCRLACSTFPPATSGVPPTIAS